MPLITAIKVQAKRANRASIFLDGKFALGVNKKVAERFGLKVGMEVTPADIEALEAGEIEQVCFDKALALLSRRMHSRRELRQKLLSKARYPEAAIEQALLRLEKLGYVNDEEFARQKLQQAQRKLIGERRAMAELMRSGLKGEIAREAITQHFSSDEARDNAQKLIEKNLPRLRRLDPVTAKRRLIGLLQRRGFDYETIMPLIAKALGSTSDDAP